MIQWERVVRCISIYKGKVIDFIIVVIFKYSSQSSILPKSQFQVSYLFKSYIF